MHAVFNPAPGWPAPADSTWLPAEGWLPDPAWPAAPRGWSLVIDVPDDVGYPTAPDRRRRVAPRAVAVPPGAWSWSLATMSFGFGATGLLFGALAGSLWPAFVLAVPAAGLAGAAVWCVPGRRAARPTA